MEIPTELSSQVSYLRKVTTGEWKSSCPQCKGDIHQDGSKPDRFMIWTKSKTTGGIMGLCRRCGYMWFPDDNDKNYKAPSPEVIEERLQLDKKNKKSEIDTYMQNIHEMQKDKPWETYQENLQDSPVAKQMMLDRGINDDWWLSYWRLGYCPDKGYSHKGQLHNSPSLTIPLQATMTREVFNIRHRLLEPVDNGDKYRPERSGLPSGLFLCDLDRELTGKCLVVEGEFKAMTTHLTIDDPDLHVVGIPGKKPSDRMFKKLDDCDPVFVCLDPDAFHTARGSETAVDRTVKIINSRGANRARVIRLPGKIDDMIDEGYLGKREIKSLMDTARKA